VRYYVELVALVRDCLEQVEGLTDADRYDYPHLTEQALYNFDFVVDASHLEMGVVRVAYVEYHRESRH
jgi:hypothetical protein